MKNYIKTLALAMLVIGVSSCSSDNDTDALNPEAPLKSYTLSRDANGSYNLEHTVADGISSSIVNDKGTNNIHLSPGNSNSNTKNAALALENGEIKIDFVTQTSLNIPGLKLIDDDITTAKGKANKETSYLKSHAISLLEDGTYQVDFTVANNVQVSFEYNETYKRHQVRLQIGDNNSVTSYSKNYIKLQGEKLTIAFVHVKTSTLGSKSLDEEEEIGPPIYETHDEEEEG